MIENLKTEKIKINGIPSMLWGEKGNKVFIAVSLEVCARSGIF